MTVNSATNLAHVFHCHCSTGMTIAWYLLQISSHHPTWLMHFAQNWMLFISIIGPPYTFCIDLCIWIGSLLSAAKNLVPAHTFLTVCHIPSFSNLVGLWYHILDYTVVVFKQCLRVMSVTAIFMWQCLWRNKIRGFTWSACHNKIKTDMFFTGCSLSIYCNLHFHYIFIACTVTFDITLVSIYPSPPVLITIFYKII